MTTNQEPYGDREGEQALKEELRTFGLSDTEVDTYLALLEQGEATTNTVSRAADVSQRAVYDIAERLADRGLVRVNDHASPTTIRALPPDEAIGSLAERLEAVTPALEERYNETEPRTPEIRMVKSRETALRRLRTAIAAAESEVFLAVPEHVYPEVEAEVAAARDRGVFVLLLVGGAADCDDAGERFAGAADVVRCWGKRLPFLYAVDDEAAMIGGSEILSTAHTDHEAVAVDEGGLAGAVLGLFLSGYWPAATEVYVTDRDPLPRTYDWFRDATLHALLHDREGVPLTAEVVTDDGTALSGRVTQVRQAFVEPSTNTFSLETSLHVDTGDDVVSVGGIGSFVEDYEAESVTLREAE